LRRNVPGGSTKRPTALQAENKTAILAEFGEEQFTIWRRSYDTPPPIKAGSDFDAIDLRDSDVPSEIRPRTECLIDFLDRVLPHWYDQIGPICKPTRWS